MSLRSEDREQLRLSLLRFLDRNLTRFGSSARLLLQMCHNEGQTRVTLQDVEAELLYLEDKELVVSPPRLISPENRVYRIAGDGRDLRAATRR